jgi:GNAT superfamily N-acetyltransferase
MVTDPTVAVHSAAAVDAGVLDRFLRDVGLRSLADGLLNSGQSRDAVDLQFRQPREVYVAVSGAEILGVLEGKMTCPERWPHVAAPPSSVFNLQVVRRRRGIGTALLTRFAADAAAAGCRSLILSVDFTPPRDGRIAFFQANGLRWCDEDRRFMGADLPLHPPT